MAQAVVPVFVEVRDVVVVVVCLVVRWVVAVVGTDSELTRRRLVEEEVDFGVAPDKRGGVAAGFRTGVVGDVRVAAEKC